MSQQSRLANTFAACREDNRAALIGYLPAGYPDVQGSIDACKAMVESGCDIIEVGIAYSDPVMDGPTIQRAAEQALVEAVSGCATCSRSSRPSRRPAARPS